MKRLFDIFFSFLGLIILSPIMLLAAIFIKLGPKGPVFFLQERVGLNGKLFKLIKFRTMVINDGNNSITTKNDPRITAIGRIIRKFKIDEIPQLINVLKGDMSFVGPRPDVAGYADELTGDDKIVLSVRPGITGPATLKFRHEEQLLAEQKDPVRYNKEVVFPEKVRLNREYARNNDLLIDLKYILMTLFGMEYKDN